MFITRLVAPSCRALLDAISYHIPHSIHIPKRRFADFGCSRWERLRACSGQWGESRSCASGQAGEAGRTVTGSKTPPACQTSGVAAKQRNQGPRIPSPGRQNPIATPATIENPGAPRASTTLRKTLQPTFLRPHQQVIPFALVRAVGLHRLLPANSPGPPEEIYSAAVQTASAHRRAVHGSSIP